MIRLAVRELCESLVPFEGRPRAERPLRRSFEAPLRAHLRMRRRVVEGRDNLSVERLYLELAPSVNCERPRIPASSS